MSKLSPGFPFGSEAELGLNTSSFTFIGPDGVQYRWALGAMGMNPGRVSPSPSLPVFPTLNSDLKLVTADEKKTVIAEFRRPCYLIKREKARLEVKPAGMDMLDYIVVTFVCVEQTRREREAAARSR